VLQIIQKAEVHNRPKQMQINITFCQCFLKKTKPKKSCIVIFIPISKKKELSEVLVKRREEIACQAIFLDKTAGVVRERFRTMKRHMGNPKRNRDELVGFSVVIPSYKEYLDPELLILK